MPYFYSHAPCGARRVRGRDHLRQERFLLTRPLRGATSYLATVVVCDVISTHTPLAGRDPPPAPSNHRRIPFLLTRPLRGATEFLFSAFFRLKFLLTRPLRGATTCYDVVLSVVLISTHTPLAGRDRKAGHRRNREQNFYSHAPCGARPEYIEHRR